MGKDGSAAVRMVGGVRGWEPEGSVGVAPAENPLPDRTLGDTGIAVEVSGSEEFPPTMVTYEVGRGGLDGFDKTSVRLFRVVDDGSGFEPVWTSGFNAELSFLWGRLTRPGTYVALGLPRDRFLQAIVRELSAPRPALEGKRGVDRDRRELLETLAEVPDEALLEIRGLLAQWEVQTAAEPVPSQELEFRQGRHLAGFALPRRGEMGDLKEQLRRLEVSPEGLPERVLFDPPGLRPDETPWLRHSHEGPWSGLDSHRASNLGILEHIDLSRVLELLPYLVSTDWWMYHHDPQHTGRASGSSSISSATVSSLTQIARRTLDGPIYTIPCVVGGKVYVGTAKESGSGGGTFYKLNLYDGAVEGRFPTTGEAFYSISGIGGSPAIVGGRAYFTTVYGQVYCVDTETMTTAPPHPAPLWVTNLKAPDAAKNQPVRNPYGDSWSSPLVVDGKVYVGSGEGEERNTYGFIWCLDAQTGRVIWLFCMSKFVEPLASGNENSPNVIPESAAVSNPLPAWAVAAGYSTVPDPEETGCAVWSSCAYDRNLNRIYVGTGNSEYVPHPPLSSKLPDQRYGSGLISLDADTGAFRGFFQPSPDDSYWPNDADIDVPGSPTIFTRHGVRVVGFGSKNGSYFLLDADTLQVLGGGAQRRQLLPRENGTGHPGDRGDPIGSVVPTGGAEDENKWGVMATAAVHRGLGIVYVGVGGYAGIGDGTKTPFLRALDWETLEDAWPTSTDAAGVTRYTSATPPMYTSNEAGLSSPALVGDVVFVTTTKPALYALDASSGVCLWSAPDLPANGRFPLGPAISGNYVANGVGTDLFVYTIGFRIPRIPEYVERVPRWWEEIGPWPPPPPPWERLDAREMGTPPGLEDFGGKVPG